MSNKITRCEIHPAIGIARVGNSPQGYFFGPEVPDGRPGRGVRFKDSAGRIRRQVARFRIYGFDADGVAVKEITADDASIRWTVHVANSKPAWYAFSLALDIPEAEPTSLRNPDYPDDRRDLVIDPGSVSITPGDHPKPLSGGTFLGEPVSLGSLRTDQRGRLTVFGGKGRSGHVPTSPCDSASAAPTTLNSARWFDDVSDGPVSATVRIDGRDVPVDPAWVVVAPPNYAPGLLSPVTMYDLMYDLALKTGGLKRPSRPSFTTHILPILRGVCDLQWVNGGMNVIHGWGSAEHYTSGEYLPDLADPSPAKEATRNEVFKRFRHPDPENDDHSIDDPSLIPQIYGDGINSIETKPGPAKWLTVTPFQYWCLEEWAGGRFLADWDADRPVTPLEELPVSEQPAALTKAALQACLGGPFHPGSEMTWPMRHASIYSSPFRIKHRRTERSLPKTGSELTPSQAVAPDGPLDGCGPGDVTRWMAVPWQIDTAQCGAGYDGRLNAYLPTLWPARVPNHILSSRAYSRVLKRSVPLPERYKLLNMREDWLRDFSNLDGSFARAQHFMENWSKVGIVTQVESPDEPGFPPEVFVETENELEKDTSFDPRRLRRY